MIEAEALRERAPAKVNLFLHVGQKRADGYHALQSLVAFTEIGDQLAFLPERELEFSICGQFASALQPDGTNLVVKAARALLAHAKTSWGALISLRKNLPVASGIGGGSADAAAALRGLSRFWGLPLSPQEMHAIAARLGSDVPVCLAGGTQWMEGRGEELTALDPLPAIAMVLVNPGVSVPTPNVFAALEQRHGTDLPPPPKFADAGGLITYLKDTCNDLEAPARTIAPQIDEVLSLLVAQPGVRLARMSGSGATCFALFNTDAEASEAADAIGGLRPGWWVVATRIAS